MNTIGKRVRFLRDQKCKTVSEVINGVKIPLYDENGEEYGCKTLTKGTIGNLENDRNKPSIDLVIALSNYFDVSTDWLLKGKEYGEQLMNTEHVDTKHLINNAKKEVIQELEETIFRIKQDL
ncbi:helix-turn-helix transcriptional regulator [Paenibacillus sp. FSL P4-0176]|uniref:helix-turn-helix domain-containing protein n=1 Tax=Paenibacillus sp. FSL P4-0176 TaxID=2921631 RepID=UPI0030CC7C49